MEQLVGTLRATPWKYIENIVNMFSTKSSRWFNVKKNLLTLKKLQPNLQCIQHVLFKQTLAILMCTQHLYQGWICRG